MKLINNLKAKQYLNTSLWALEDGSIYDEETGILVKEGKKISTTFNKDTNPTSYYLQFFYKHIGVLSSHRVVCTAWHENPENKKEVNHINGIKYDNRPSNLEWCTRSENMIHADTTGLRLMPRGINHHMYGKTGINNHSSVKVQQLNSTTLEVLRVFNSATEAMVWIVDNEYTSSTDNEPANIINCCKGNSSGAYGFKWRYNDEMLRPKEDKLHEKHYSKYTKIRMIDPNTKEVLRIFDTSTDAIQYAMRHGLSSCKYPDAYEILNCCRGKSRLVYKHHWEFDDEYMRNQYEPFKSGASNIKAVYRIDPRNDEVLQIHESISDATRFISKTLESDSIIGIANIVKCCKGQRSMAYGFKWRYENVELHSNFKPFEKNTSNYKPVVQLDISTRNPINIFNSAADAKRFCVENKYTLSNDSNPGKITKVCRGEAKSVYGFAWEFLKN